MQIKSMYVIVFSLVFYFCNCKHFRDEKYFQAKYVVDTIIVLQQNQRLQILKNEFINPKKKSNLSASIRLSFENLSDSAIILCNSGMDRMLLDSIFYLSYVMDWEEQCEFLLIPPKTKVEISETLFLNGASGYRLTFDLISNFSMNGYEKYFSIKNIYVSDSNSYMSIGIKEYPPEIWKVEISRYTVRSYKTKY